MLTDRTRNLYQEVILDHNKNPRNFREIEQPSHTAKGHNPLCGDKLDVYLVVNEDGIVEDASFLGDGCSLSKASASIMTSIVKGKSVDVIKDIFYRFHDMATGKAEFDSSPEFKRLSVFSGVRNFPVRVKCVTLSWHTLQAALEKKEEISTE